MDIQSRNYWLDLFTWETWQEFLQAGGDVSGFREGRWTVLQKVKPGDYFLCYLTGVSRFIGILEVISTPFQDNTPIWGRYPFPCRVKVKIIIQLTPETAVPVLDLRDKLSVFQNLKNSKDWSGAFRGSPNQWKSSDGEIIFNALRDAELNPISRGVDQKKLNKKPFGITSKVGKVVIPPPVDLSIIAIEDQAGEIKKHTEIQFQLLKLGYEMGFTVWVAKNDRNRDYKGRRFSDHFPFKDSLPLQFDDATTKTIELIDVLWLKGNAIIAAFEIESTTSIYSGLLRMSDLIAMQPNLNVNLYLVAPEDRRNKVFTEINRPTFRRLTPPLSRACRFISFTSFQNKLKEVQGFIKFLKPEFLDELSEACGVEE
jgi:hypothetical protein